MKSVKVSLVPLFEPNLLVRHRTGRIYHSIFRFATLLGIFMLFLLLLTILNDLLGYATISYKIPPQSLAIDGTPLDQLSNEQLRKILETHLSSGSYSKLEKEKSLEQRAHQELDGLVWDRVVNPKTEKSWSLADSIFSKENIVEEVGEKYPATDLRFVTWFNMKFLFSSASSDPLRAGVRTALLGSLWTISITILVAFPLGVGAAIYLEEYATNNWLNRLLKTNISNLAGVPSIIYGILGLAIFVRGMQPITSGAFLSSASGESGTGRTILSAGLTLALLVLPIIIINAQEAIRAVPLSLRQASLGLGATKWQTIWHHVLPNAIPGILTGTILAISRALGETAPLVVIGAATFITFDPSGPFSKFTTLPIQIYQWVARPQNEFRNIASAAILTLMGVVLSLTTVAILLRNHYQTRK